MLGLVRSAAVPRASPKTFSTVSQMLLPRMIRAGLLCAALVGASAAIAREVQVVVDARVPPWDPRTNRKLAFGSGDLRPPKIIFDARLFEGALIRFKATGRVAWITGGTRNGPNGDPNMILDRSVAFLPGHYIKNASRALAMGQLVGAFVDADGRVVGSPFSVGEEAEVRAPAGATAIALGINDDILADNNGSFSVTVLIPEAQVTVEPGD